MELQGQDILLPQKRLFRAPLILCDSSRAWRQCVSVPVPVQNGNFLGKEGEFCERKLGEINRRPANLAQTMRGNFASQDIRQKLSPQTNAENGTAGLQELRDKLLF